MTSTFTLVIIAVMFNMGSSASDTIAIDHIDGFVSIEECQSAGHALSGLSKVDKTEWICVLKNVKKD